MKWFSRKSEPMSMPETALMLIFIVMAITIVLLALALAGSSAQAISADRVNFRTATRQAPVTPHSDKVTSRVSSPIATIYMEISAYSPSVQECDATPLITASGKRVYVGGIAADLDVLPFGSIVIIPNYNNGNPCTVIDTGGAIQGNKLDVFMWSTDAAIHFGRRHNVRVTVLYIPTKATR